MKNQFAFASILSLSLAATVPVHNGAHSFQVGQAVHTTSGTVIGQAAPNLTAVSEYLGIPYAKPPVGQLRFAAPKPFVGYGKINATSYVRCPIFSISINVSDMSHIVSVRLPDTSMPQDIYK